MQGLIELNLRGVMHSAGPATVHTLTALQALTGMLLFPSDLIIPVTGVQPLLV